MITFACFILWCFCAFLSARGVQKPKRHTPQTQTTFLRIFPKIPCQKLFTKEPRKICFSEQEQDEEQYEDEEEDEEEEEEEEEAQEEEEEQEQEEEKKYVSDSQEEEEEEKAEAEERRKRKRVRIGNCRRRFGEALMRTPAVPQNVLATCSASERPPCF
jgi:hypothetical protein